MTRIFINMKLLCRIDWSDLLHLTVPVEKWEYNGSLHLFFIDYKKTNDSVMKEVL